MHGKYICRSKSRKPFWLIRFPVVHKKTFKRTIIEKIFYDESFDNNKYKAFNAALEYRKSLIKIYGWPIKPPFQKQIKSNNKSGISGVHYTKFTRNKYKNNKHYKYLVENWVATWRQYGKIKSKSFPILKYGYNQAYELAIEYRLKKEKELLNSI